MDNIVIVVLWSNSKIGLVDVTEPPTKFLSSNELFCRANELGDWIGFYDWLRTSTGAIVGVQLSLDAQISRDLFQRFNHPCLEVVDGETVKIFFENLRSFDESLSQDQDFGENWLYRGTQGSMAISFSCPQSLEKPNAFRQTKIEIVKEKKSQKWWQKWRQIPDR